MQRIDENAGAGMIDVLHDPCRRRQVRDACPGHEFEIGRQSKLGCGFAKLREAIRKPCQIRIVAGDENVFAPRRAPASKNGVNEAMSVSGLNATTSRSATVMPVASQPLERLPHERSIVHQAIGNPPGIAGSNLSPTCS